MLIVDTDELKRTRAGGWNQSVVIDGLCHLLTRLVLQCSPLLEQPMFPTVSSWRNTHNLFEGTDELARASEANGPRDFFDTQVCTFQ